MKYVFSAPTRIAAGARDLSRNVRTDRRARKFPKPPSLSNTPADCRRRAEAALWRAAKAESPRSVAHAATTLNTNAMRHEQGEEALFATVGNARQNPRSFISSTIFVRFL